MTKKGTTKLMIDSELDDSIPLRVSHGQKTDMGIPRSIKACSSDKPESPRKRRIPKVEDDLKKKK